MRERQKAIIFDMDGVVVNSEHLWAQAEYEVFTALGVEVTHELAVITKSMTTIAVASFWYERFPWENTTLQEVEELVISRVIALIEAEHCEIAGIKLFLMQLKAKGYKIGLATNSPYRIIPAVLEKAGIADYFDTIASAEFEPHGKPHPGIYLSASKKLNIDPQYCIAIEDSYSGMLAAKTAGMKVVAFTNGGSAVDLSLADHIIDEYENHEMEAFHALL